MKKMILAILMLALALGPVAALADSTIRTQGSATLTVAPDTAVLNIGYAGESEDSSKAQQQAADAIEAIVAALEALGIAEDDIVTSNLNTYPVYNYTDDGQTLRGYRVEHMLSVTINDLEQAGDVLDAALGAGANQANAITYKSSQEKEVYLKALALAVENAKEKAEALAVATGMWLDRLEEVNEATGYGTLRYANEAKYESDAGASLGGTIRTGELQVTATVELVYETR